MEIERKFLITAPPSDLGKCSRHLIEQGYLNTEPVVRIRREDDTYYLTYKGAGLMAHEEYNLPLTAKAYEHLKEKVDGCLISKTRYLIPYERTHDRARLFPFAEGRAVSGGGGIRKR